MLRPRLLVVLTLHLALEGTRYSFAESPLEMSTLTHPQLSTIQAQNSQLREEHVALRKAHATLREAHEALHQDFVALRESVRALETWAHGSSDRRRTQRTGDGTADGPREVRIYSRTLSRTAAAGRGRRRTQAVATCDVELRTTGVTAACCGESGEFCAEGAPTSCNIECANVLLPFWEDCRDFLDKSTRHTIDAVVRECQEAWSRAKMRAWRCSSCSPVTMARDTTAFLHATSSCMGICYSQILTEKTANTPASSTTLSSRGWVPHLTVGI